jgi:hypothetical protein
MDMLDRKVNKTLVQILEEMNRLIIDPNTNNYFDTDQLELLCKTAIALAKGNLTEVGSY